MADIVSKEVRSKMMAGIRSSHTVPELLVRKYLHAQGFRFALRRRPDLPCQPDLILPKYRAVIFVHGCFWHRHEGCRFASTPKSNTIEWERKFARNVERDTICRLAFQQQNWRTAEIWECALKGNRAENLKALAMWLKAGDRQHIDIGQV